MRQMFNAHWILILLSFEMVKKITKWKKNMLSCDRSVCMNLFICLLRSPLLKYHISPTCHFYECQRSISLTYFSTNVRANAVLRLNGAHHFTSIFCACQLHLHHFLHLSCDEKECRWNQTMSYSWYHIFRSHAQCSFQLLLHIHNLVAWQSLHITALLACLFWVGVL